MRALLAFLVACDSVPSPLTPVDEPQSFTVTTRVCLWCTGPQAIDAEGHTIASVFVTVDGRATGIHVDSLDLFDANGTRVAHGSQMPYIGFPDGRPFDGRVTGHAALWTGARLDALDTWLAHHRPARYLLRIASDDGVVEVAGTVEPPGATGQCNYHGPHFDCPTRVEPDDLRET